MNLGIAASNASSQSMSAGGFIMSLIFTIFFFFCWWKIFEKCGYEGWKCIIPIYNTYCMFEMFYGNGWSFLWLICPIANIVVGIKYIIRMCHSFGWYGAKVLIAFFFSPIAIILFAFGGDKYLGPNGGK